MGRVIVHIGTHKTGTTSIQRALSRNRDFLHENKVLYPDYKLIGLRSHYAHLGMANALTGAHEKFSVQDAERFFRFARDMASDFDHTIISAEPLYRQISGKVPPQKIQTPERYWRARDEYIARFRSLIGPAEIAIVIRRQDQFAESMYQEQIKVTRHSLDFADFLENFWFHFDYTAQVRAWKKHFSTIHIIPFDRIKGDDITGSFLNHIGIDLPIAPSSEAKNVSMPHDGVILKRHLNKSDLPDSLLARAADILVSPAFRAQLPAIRRSFFASEDARRNFLSSYDATNAELATMAGLAPDDLFESKVAKSLHYGDQLPPAEMDRLLALLGSCDPKLKLGGIGGSDLASPPEADGELPAFDATGLSKAADFLLKLGSCRLDYTACGDTLVVSFDNAGAPHREAPDRRPWGHKFLVSQGYSVLGVIAGSSDWYRGKDLHAALIALRDTGFFKSFQTVVFTGSSMGGYGATAFAELAPGCRIISFNPQSTLRRDLVPWDRQHANGMKQSWSGLFSDGAEGAKSAAVAYIFYDPFNKMDRRHAQRYQGENIRLMKAPLLGHGLPSAYHDMGLLKDVMLRGISGTLEDAWHAKAMRKRRTQPKYYKTMIEPLIQSQRFTIGQSVMQQAFAKFNDPYFKMREAVFAAAAGRVTEAMSLLDTGKTKKKPASKPRLRAKLAPSALPQTWQRRAQSWLEKLRKRFA